MTVQLKQTQVKPEIAADILIEELVDNYPFAVRYLMQNKIRCIMCGEPIWGTLEEAAKEKGYNDADIERFIAELKTIFRESQETES